jgi:hypothetical protein
MFSPILTLQGCRVGVVEFFQDNLIAAGGIGVAFGLLEVSLLSEIH